MLQAIFYLFAFILVISAVMVTFAQNPVHSVLYLILAFFNAAGLFILLNAELLAMLLVIVYVGAVAVLFLFVVMMLDVVPFPKREQKLWPQIVQSAHLCLNFILYGLFFLLIAGALDYFLTWITENFVVRREFLQESPVPIFASLLTAYVILRYGFKKSLWKMGQDFIKTIPLGGLLGLVILAEVSYLSAHQKSLTFLDFPAMGSMVTTSSITNTQAIGKVLYTDYILLFQLAGFILLTAMIGAIVLTHRKREGVRRQNIREQIARRKEDTLELHDMPIGKGVH